MRIFRGDMVSSSPVCGFLPRRACFVQTTNFPNPLIMMPSPSASVSFMSSREASKKSEASDRVTFIFSCILRTISAFVMDVFVAYVEKSGKGAMSPFLYSGVSPAYLTDR